jgi:hypothetical protein
MRVDIDKLEALEKLHRVPTLPDKKYCVECLCQGRMESFPCETILLVREVRELRGIAEAARETSSGWDEDHPLVVALARYDAGVTPAKVRRANVAAGSSFGGDPMKPETPEYVYIAALEQEIAALRTQLEQAQARGEAFQAAAKTLGEERNAWRAIAQESNPEVAKAFEQAEARETALLEALELAKDWGCFGPGMTIDGFTAKHGNVSKEQMAQIVARALSGEGSNQ